MRRKEPTTVADIEGRWEDPAWDTELIRRCKSGWNTPVSKLTNAVLATYLRQKMGLALVIPEARRRIAAKFFDDTEKYDEELENALKSATGGS